MRDLLFLGFKRQCLTSFVSPHHVCGCLHWLQRFNKRPIIPSTTIQKHHRPSVKTPNALFFCTHSSCFSSVFLVSDFLFIFSASLIVASLLCPLLLIYPSSSSNLPAHSLIFLSSLPRCLWATYPSSCTVRPLKYGSGFIIYLLSLSLFSTLPQLSLDI